MGKNIFKAKRIDRGEVEWVEGYLAAPHMVDTEKGVESYNFYELDERGWTSYCIVSADTVSQYTGMAACWMAFENEVQECDVWEHDLLEVNYKGKKVLAKVTYASCMYVLTSKEFEEAYIPLSDYIRVESGDAYIDAVHKGNIFDDLVFAYQVFLNDECVSHNCGYDTEEEARLYADSDVKRLACEGLTVKVYEVLKGEVLV